MDLSNDSRLEQAGMLVLDAVAHGFRDQRHEGARLDDRCQTVDSQDPVAGIGFT
jgi:hypothetical protein